MIGKQLYGFLLFFVCLNTIVASAQCDINGVYINAYLVDPSGATDSFDTDGSGTVNDEDEFVQICNGSTNTVNISGWTIEEGAGDIFEFNATNGPSGNRITNTDSSISSGECYTVLRGLNGGSLGTNMLDWGYSNSALNNSSDSIKLSDGNTTCTINYTTSNWSAGCATLVGLGSGDGSADCSLTPSDLGSTPLPVELIEFTAEKKQNRIVLSWQTAMELNNQLFEVQKSEEGTSFYTIAEVAGAGTTNEVSRYSYTDIAVWPTAYYRLKQIDYDGSYSFSNVLRIDEPKELITIRPNQEGFKIESKSEHIAEVKMLSINGQELWSTQFEDTLDIETTNLLRGTYILIVYTNAKAQYHRFVK